MPTRFIGNMFNHAPKPNERLTFVLGIISLEQKWQERITKRKGNVTFSRSLRIGLVCKFQMSRIAAPQRPTSHLRFTVSAGIVKWAERSMKTLKNEWINKNAEVQ
jgi:hypothetical protein